MPALAPAKARRSTKREQYPETKGLMTRPAEQEDVKSIEDFGGKGGLKMNSCSPRRFNME
jgi:hypothetical protein